jgi:peroxiredoxin
MANELTGEFDVVAEFSIQAVNNILAAQHQSEVYLHSIPASIDDAETGVHGSVQIQVSTPTVTLPPDEDARRVSIHYQIMAHMVADRNSAAVPEFIHGEVDVTLGVAQTTSDTEDLIEIDLNASDIEVMFTPDPGAPLTEEETTQVNQIIGNFLRNGFQPVETVVMLPGRGEELRVHHWRFKTMPEDERPAIALLLNLSDRVPAAEHRAAITQVFLEEADDFAVAIGRDFLEPTLLELIEDALPSRISGTERLGIELFGKFIGITVRYTVTLDLDSVRVELSEGRIRISVDGTLTTNWANGTFTVTQDFGLTTDGDSIGLVAPDDPDVRLELKLPFLARFAEGRIADEMVDAVRTARDRALRDAGPLVQGLPSGFQDIFPELRVPTPGVVYTEVEIQSEGVIVRGTLTFQWQDVVATFATRQLHAQPEDAEGVVRSELNAFDSWIPGGTIHRFRWVYGAEGDIQDEIVEEHKFITQLTRDVLHIDIRQLDFRHALQLCLEVSGTQGAPPREVSGWSCSVGAPQGPALEDVGGGGFSVDVTDSGGAVVAHVNPLWPGNLRPGVTRPPRIRGAANMLVHFADSTSFTTGTALRDALVSRSRRDAAVVVVFVLPPGAVVEPLKLDANVGWARTEDAEQAWAKALRALQTPATFLVNPEGKIVWHQDGPLEAIPLIAALDEHLVTGRPLRWQQLSLKVRVGEPAPDFLFEYLNGRRIAIRHLRRRPMLLNFWKSWSTPCLAELHHLQKMHDRFARDGLVILAVNSGEDPQRARRVFKENGFSFAFVADADREISKLYGVNCWPTTVSLNEKGIIRHIYFGANPGKRHDALSKVTTPRSNNADFTG